MRKTLSILLLLAGSAFVAQTAKADDVCASAQNLVSNCGFESGDFTGWTGTALSTFNTSNFFTGVDGSDPHSGNYAAYLGAFPVDASLTQTLATVAGATYTVSFYLDNSGAPLAGYPNDFSVLFGGNTLLSLSNAAPFGYTLETFQITATGSSTALTFNSANDNYYWDLDSVSVTQNVAATPEPSSLVLLGSGLVGVAGVARRKLMS